MGKADTAREEAVRQIADLQRLPSVDQVLHAPSAALGIERYGRAAVVNAVRSSLSRARAAKSVFSIEQLAGDALAQLEARALPRLRPVFNLTGTVLHTNLGRALIAQAAVDAAVTAMQAAVALEFNVGTGRRGE